MVKVSITLPNKAQITFESEEPEIIHEIVGMVLRDLPRELMLSVAAETANGNGIHSPAQAPSQEKGNDVPTALLSTPAPPEAPATVDAPPDEAGVPPAAGEAGEGPAKSKEGPAPPQAAQGRDLSPAEQEFVAFCHSSNPLGDMRRVVAAAEGARRFLSRTSVDADELGRLFDLAGWTHPHSFVQTLRNSARSKFRWLERVPGRAGHYSVTDLGRGVALGE